MNNFGRAGSQYSDSVLHEFDHPQNVGQLDGGMNAELRSAAWGDVLKVSLSQNDKGQVEKMLWHCLGSPVVIASASWVSRQTPFLADDIANKIVAGLNLSAEQRYAALLVANAIGNALKIKD